MRGSQNARLIVPLVAHHADEVDAEARQLLQHLGRLQTWIPFSPQMLPQSFWFDTGLWFLLFRHPTDKTTTRRCSLNLPRRPSICPCVSQSAPASALASLSLPRAPLDPPLRPLIRPFPTPHAPEGFLSNTASAPLKSAPEQIERRRRQIEGHRGQIEDRLRDAGAD